MIGEGRDGRTSSLRTRGTRGGLVAAGLLLVLTLAFLWLIAEPREADGVSAPEARGSGPPIDAPAFAAAPPPHAGPAKSADVGQPAPLVARPAGLVVRADEEGLHLTDPYVRLTRSADGWQAVGDLSSSSEAAWAGLPAGDYALESLGEAWTLPETSVALAPGEQRVVALRAVRPIRVRVVGGRSGRPVEALRVQVAARYGSSGDSFLLCESHDVLSADGRFVLLGLPVYASDGRVAELRLEVDSGPYSTGRTEWLPVAAFLPGAEFTVPVPEAAIVGRVVRAEFEGVGLPPIEVYLLPARSNLADARNELRARANERTSPSNETITMRYASVVDSSFEFDLARAPAEPLRVVATDGIHAPAASGPLVIPPTGDPLRVDLVLEPGGKIEGKLLVPLATTRTGELRPMLVINGLQSRRVDEGAPPFLPRVETSYSYGHEEMQGVPPSRAALHFVVDALAAGEYEITLRVQPDAVLAGPPAAGRQLKRRAHVAAGETTELLLELGELAAGPLLRGSVRLPAALAGASVGIELWPEGADARSEVMLATRANASGQFALADVPPGRFTLLAVTYDGGGREAVAFASAVMGSHDLELPPLDLSRPELRLRAPSGTNITVTGSAEHPVLARMLAAAWFSPTTNETGTASIFGLPPGHYAASSDGVPVEFEIAPGAALVEVEVP